jgi:hypothetical protein
MSAPPEQDLKATTGFSVTQIADAIHANFDEMMLKIPVLSEAVETVNQGFDTLLTSIEPVELWEFVVHAMAIGAHSGWLDGLILITVGHRETASGALRRAIEFCCYASKVTGSDSRAEDWCKFHEDAVARQRFCGVTKIPDSFRGRKYEAVQPLIVLHNMYSETGAHANMAALVGKWKGLQGSTLAWDYQVDYGQALSEAVIAVDAGRQIVEIFVDQLKNRIKDRKAVDKVIELAFKRSAKLRVEYAATRFPNGIPPGAVKAIVTGDKSMMRGKFRSLLNKGNASELSC